MSPDWVSDQKILVTGAAGTLGHGLVLEAVRQGARVVASGREPTIRQAVFPAGVYAAGGFEAVRDFDASSKERFVQSKDKATGFPLWTVEGIDADATARQRTVAERLGYSPKGPGPTTRRAANQES